MSGLLLSCGQHVARELDGDHGEEYGVRDVTLANVDVAVEADFEKAGPPFRFAFVRLTAGPAPEPIIQLKG